MVLLGTPLALTVLMLFHVPAARDRLLPATLFRAIKAVVTRL
jgi:hypothetical protein